MGQIFKSIVNIIRLIKKILKDLIGKAGYKIEYQTDVLPKGYERLNPDGTYAPWALDKEFMDVYSKINRYTHVHKYRCFELWQLVDQVQKIKGAILEVGVWRGGSGAILAKRAKLLGLMDKVYLADTFEGVVKASERDNFYVGNEHADTDIGVVQNLIYKVIKLDNVEILKGIFPEDTAHLIDNNEKFCLCHIDVDVYNSAKDVIEWIWPKLSVGGIVVYDDYGFEVCKGITDFVDEESLKDDRVFIYNLNGHGIIIKLK